MYICAYDALWVGNHKSQVICLQINSNNFRVKSLMVSLEQAHKCKCLKTEQMFELGKTAHTHT